MTTGENKVLACGCASCAHLKRLVAGRDAFIVEHGHFPAFVKWLDTPEAEAATDDMMESAGDGT